MSYPNASGPSRYKTGLERRVEQNSAPVHTPIISGPPHLRPAAPPPANMQSRALLFLSLLLLALAPSQGCQLKGKCDGFCEKEFKGVNVKKPCKLKCGKIKCEQNCDRPELCTGRAACVKRCAFKTDKKRSRTIVRCWCLVFGSCNKKCDCKGPSFFPWVRVKFTPFAGLRTESTV